MILIIYFQMFLARTFLKRFHNDALNRVYDSNNEYILSAFSASFTTQDYSVAQAVDEL